MVDGDMVEGGIIAFTGSPEQEFKIHHIVDNDRALPFLLIVVPRTDNTRLRLGATGQCTC